MPFIWSIGKISSGLVDGVCKSNAYSCRAQTHLSSNLATIIDTSQQRLPVSRRHGIKPGPCACLSAQSEEPSCKQCAALRLAEASSALFHQHKPLHCQLQRLCLPLETGVIFQIHGNQHFMVCAQFGHKQGESVLVRAQPSAQRQKLNFSSY